MFLTIIPAGILVFADNRLFYGCIRWRSGDHRITIGYYQEERESSMRVWVDGHLVNMTRLWSLRPPRKSDFTVSIDVYLGDAVREPQTRVLDGDW